MKTRYGVAVVLGHPPGATAYGEPVRTSATPFGERLLDPVVAPRAVRAESAATCTRVGADLRAASTTVDRVARGRPRAGAVRSDASSARSEAAR